MEIYFEDGKKAKNLTILLNLGFNFFGKFVRTYKDPECTQAQCFPARRSFGALLEIAQTYFPATTNKELAYTLLKECDHMACFYCSTTKLIVFIADRSVNPDCFSARMHPSYDEAYKDSTGLCYNTIQEWAEEYAKLKEPLEEVL